MRIVVFLLACVLAVGLYAVSAEYSQPELASNTTTGTVLGQSTIKTPVTTSEDDPLLAAVNRVRVANNVTLLANDTTLSATSLQRVKEMAKSSIYSHDRADGSYFTALLKQYDKSYQYACENLQLQEGKNINDAINAWLKSPGHRACLLNPDVEFVGVAVSEFDDVVMQGDSTSKLYVYAIILSY